MLDSDHALHSAISHQGLLQQRATLESILDGVVDGLIVADRDGTVLFLNRSAARILYTGYAEVPMSAWPEAYGLFLDDEVTLHPTADLPVVRASHGHTVHDKLLFVRNPNVTEGAWISMSAAPWIDGSGTRIGVIATFRDVTLQRESSERVQHLDNVVETIADSVLITDRDGVILYVNPAFEQTTGYGLTEVFGQTPRVLRSGKQGPQYYARMWTTLLAGDTFRGTLVNRQKSGRLYWAAQTITPMLNPAGVITHFVSVMKDMTERMGVAEQTAELRLASRVQRGLYPHHAPLLTGVEVAGAAKPSAQMCGDYYDYFIVQDQKLGLAVSDVSGHGLGPALVMVGARASLHSCIQTWESPTRVLQQMNRTLLDDLHGSHYLTMPLACVDARAKTLTYVNAGHPSGYLLDSSGRTKLILESTCIPLGILPDLLGIAERVVAIEPGDLILLLSDGFLESPNPRGEFMGVEDLLEIVARHHDAPVQSILGSLYEGLELFVEGEIPEDDVTALICRVS